MSLTPRLAGVLTGLAVCLGAALAQQSASFRLDEHTMHAAGRPAGGAVSESADFRMTLDGSGDAAAHPTSSEGNFRLEGGFVPAYRPPQEITDLRVVGDTIGWHGDPAAGVFNLYRDEIADLGGGSVGHCEQSELTSASATDPSIPDAGTALLYLATAVNRLGEEGTLGSSSAGAERIAATPCP